MLEGREEVVEFREVRAREFGLALDPFGGSHELPLHWHRWNRNLQSRCLLGVYVELNRGLPACTLKEELPSVRRQKRV